MSRTFTTRSLKFGRTVQLEVGYCLGDGPVSVYSSSCVMKLGPTGFLTSEMIAWACGAVTTFGCVSGVVHGNTLAGASGMVSLGCIVAVVVGCGDMMASPKITVSCDRTFSLMMDNF